MSRSYWNRRFLSAGVPVLAAVLFLTGSVFSADRPNLQTSVIEEIVAKINGDIITRGELEKTRAQIEADLRKKGIIGDELDKAVQKSTAEALEAQIDQLLLVQKAKALNIKVDAEVNKQIADIQLNSKIADNDKFHDLIRQETGSSYEDFRLLIENRLLTQRVLSEEVWRTVIIPNTDMQKYYDLHKKDFIRKESVALSEIQVSTGDNSPGAIAAAEKKAKALVDRARSGTDKFSDLARDNSDNNLTAADGGFLDVFQHDGTLAKQLEDAVFKLQKGAITDPIRVSGAFEIFKVEDHIPEGQASFDEVAGDINRILAEPLVEPKRRDYMTGLRQDAFIQIKPGYVDAGALPNKDTAWQDTMQLRAETTTKAAVANRRRFKKILGVIPYGRTGGEVDDAPATPATTPVQQTPVKLPDGTDVK